MDVQIAKSVPSVERVLRVNKMRNDLWRDGFSLPVIVWNMFAKHLITLGTNSNCLSSIVGSGTNMFVILLATTATTTTICIVIIIIIIELIRLFPFVPFRFVCFPSNN